MVEIYRKLKTELQENNFTMKTASVEHVKEIEAEFARMRELALLDKDFDAEYLSWMDFNYKNEMPDARSIIVLSVPQAKTMLHFHRGVETVDVPIPPTYVYGKLLGRVENVMRQVLAAHGFTVKRTFLPAKLLAARTGMAMYGKNNISYTRGAGSFHRLFTFYSNMPAIADDWRDAAVMPECEKCNACAKACPSKCIGTGGRFLIHAEKCLTGFNERVGAFPDWIDKSWHNSIVGCMVCQAVCPVNRPYIDKIEYEADFTPEETEAILNETPQERLPVTLAAKLADLDLTEYYEVLGRNLAVLLNRRTVR